MTSDAAALRGPLRPRPHPRQQPGLGLRRPPAARGRRRHGRARGRRRRQQRRHRRAGAPRRRRPGRRHARRAARGAVEAPTSTCARWSARPRSSRAWARRSPRILFAGGRLALLHVGDSRAYLLRDGQLSQITHDDTFVQTLIDDGRITPEEANSHPQRSLLAARPRTAADVEPDLSMREARAGDRYLLCSDGLSGVVSRGDHRRRAAGPRPAATADRLIELALRGGGPDNITVIVADVIEDRPRRCRIEPVVDGAAGGNVGQRQVDARLRPPGAPPWPIRRHRAAAHRRQPPPGGGPSARRRPLRLILVAVMPSSSCSWRGRRRPTPGPQHWFVGVDRSGEQVAVFRGLDVSIVGFDLLEVERHAPTSRSPT